MSIFKREKVEPIQVRPNFLAWVRNGGVFHPCHWNEWAGTFTMRCGHKLGVLDDGVLSVVYVAPSNYCTKEEK